MVSKAIVFAITFVMLVALLATMVEFFLPLSAKSDMDVYCRNTLLKMELEGGLSDQGKSDLISKLNDRGFSNVIINGTADAKQGDELNIHVEADFQYSRLTALFTRVVVTQNMIYDKVAMARKVVN